MKKKFHFYYFWLFILASVCGWCIEVLFTFLTKHIFLNHSSLVIGPFGFAYGIGAVTLTFLLKKFKDKKKIDQFLVGFIGGSVLEYIMSFGMELVLGFSAWDYSHLPLNINGRICLLFSSFWGVLGILWIELIIPFVDKAIKKIEEKVPASLTYLFILFLLFDALLTCYAVIRAKKAEQGLPPKNKIEQVLDKTFNKNYLKNMFNDSWR